MTDELNAELHALAGEAAAVDNATQPAPEVEQPQAEALEAEVLEPYMSPEDEAAKIIDFIAWGVEKMYPVLTYRDETKKEAAQRLAPLLEKYDLQGTVFGKWGHEFEAGMFFFGVGYASVMAVKAAKVAEMKSEEQDTKSWFAKFFNWSKA